MSEPCRQEDAIDDIKDTLRRVAKALETIAAQGEAIRHLQEDSRDMKSSINSIFTRIRNIEMQPARELSKIKVAVGSAVISALVTGAGAVIMQHLVK